MEKSPTISVIMSVFKEPIEWLCQSIDSIVNQTFKDFEFIIICDNPDYEEGIAILKKYAIRDDRIKLLFNVTNIGLTKSLNKGLSIAQGYYIARMDADDISLPNRLEEQVAFMEANPKCVASGSFARIIDEKGRKGTYWKTETKWEALKSTALFSSPILHPTAIFKRVINDKSISYNESKRYAQDYALWASLIGKYVILNYNKILLLYRHSGDQISSNHNLEQSKSAIDTQSILFNELGLNSTPEIKKAISIITKSLSEFYSLRSLTILLYEFISSNSDNTSIDIKILKKMVFQYFCLYLPHYVGFLKAWGCALSLSKMIGTISLRPLTSMTYHCLHSILIKHS